MTYSIRFFSGTGNTQRAVQVMAKALSEYGHRAVITDISPCAFSDSVSEFDALILAFPTYAWMPPSIVLKYIDNLPEGLTKPAYVLAVDGGAGMGAPETAAFRLRSRGYDVRLAQSASYTENWTQFVPVPDKAEQARLTAQGDAMAAQFARAVVSGRRSIKRSGLPGIFLSLLGRLYLLLGRRILGYAFIADSDCTGCGLCVKVCPVQAIYVGKSDPKKIPLWKFSCEGCNRCINICPRKAINTSVARLAGMVAGAAVFSVIFAVCWLAFRSGVLAAGGVETWMDIAGGTAAVFLGHYLALGVLPKLFNRIQKIPCLQAFFAFSFTKKTGRYLAPDYKPDSTRFGTFNA